MTERDETKVKIISGGQTGVDRAALDVALKHGIDSGGWCPSGRLDEFGRIPDGYPVRELEQGGFIERTLQNVKDADGTVIIYLAKLSGGTEQTVRFAEQQQRPRQLIDASKISIGDAAGLIADFVRKHRIHILNVAGPRQSEWSDGYEYALGALDGFVKSITSNSTSTSKSKRQITRSGAPSLDRAAPRNTRE